MKKILLIALLSCLASCSNLFHSSHYHLELVKAKKGIQFQQKLNSDKFNAFVDSFEVLNLSADILSDSTSLDFLSQQSRSPISFSHQNQIHPAESNPNLISLYEQLKQEIKPDDDQNEKEKREWNKAAVWEFIFAIAGLVFLPLAIVALFLGETAKRNFAVNPNLRGRGLAQIASILVAVEIVFLVIYTVILIVLLIACSQPGASCP